LKEPELRLQNHLRTNKPALVQAMTTARLTSNMANTDAPAAAVDSEPLSGSGTASLVMFATVEVSVLVDGRRTSSMSTVVIAWLSDDVGEDSVTAEVDVVVVPSDAVDSQSESRRSGIPVVPFSPNAANVVEVGVQLEAVLVLLVMVVVEEAVVVIVVVVVFVVEVVAVFVVVVVAVFVVVVVAVLVVVVVVVLVVVVVAVLVVVVVAVVVVVVVVVVVFVVVVLDVVVVELTVVLVVVAGIS